MPKFQVEVPHSLQPEEAKARLERFVELLRAEHGDRATDLSQTWVDNVLSFGFKTFGIKIGGNIAVEDGKLAVNGDLPFSAMMFKGNIESEIRYQLPRLMR